MTSLFRDVTKSEMAALSLPPPLCLDPVVWLSFRPQHEGGRGQINMRESSEILNITDKNCLFSSSAFVHSLITRRAVIR